VHCRALVQFPDYKRSESRNYGITPVKFYDTSVVTRTVMEANDFRRDYKIRDSEKQSDTVSRNGPLRFPLESV
jgi:hypothetical protein